MNGLSVFRWLRLRRLLVGGTAIVFILILVGYSLPSEARLPETVAVLDASSDRLFPLFNSRAGHKSIWMRATERAGAEVIPPMTHADLGGPDAGVGTRTCFCLNGEGLGLVGAVLSPIVRGHGVILESEPDRRVVYAIDFGLVALARTIELEPVDDNRTRVVWLETLRASNPFGRYLLLASSAVGRFDGVLAAAEEVARPGG